MKIVIPAYEPDKKLFILVRDIKQNSNYDIIIVNDGSSDKCNFIFAKAVREGCIVLSHSTNLGKGTALKTAFSHILNGDSEDDGVVCADCDGQHTWEDIKKIAETIVWHQSEIILGSREFEGAVPLKSLIGNKITRFIFSLASGCKIPDTQTGLRGFPAGMLPWLTGIKGDRYEYEMNQLLEAKASGYGIFSIPIRTIYENNNSGSHFRPVYDSIKIYVPIMKFAISSASCGIIDFISLFILNWLTGNLFLSVVGARVISSIFNYLLNKNIVFKAKKQNFLSSAVKYYGLVAVIMICNYSLIYIFTDILSLNLLTAKVLTELILFFASYYTQKKYIFAGRHI